MRRMFGVLSLLGIFCYVASAASQAQPELTEVDAWLVRDPQMSSQFVVADALGYFKDEGIKVNIRWYISGTDLPSMWGAGNIHLGTATATMLVPIAASGQSIYNIAPQSDVAGTQQFVLGPRAKVSTPKDLETLKIGMAKGASITMAIEAMCKETGVDFGKLQFINLSPPDQVTALAKGDIDAMAAWAPWVINAVKQAKGKVYFTGNHSYIPGKEGPVDWLLVHAGVVASGEYVQKYPQTLKAVLRALKHATTTINQERDKVVPIIAREMKLPEETARDIMALNVYSMEMNEKIYRGMGEFVEFLHTLDRIPQKIDPGSVFYTKLLEEVDPSLVKWKSTTALK
ncbi:MAG TPA: ABC transporter substrate-binding protein [Alphaproteobacteria bacterium]|nr:ABC transporter substrate-binding protein [Alphaproteobacteria bacterium]